MPVGVVDYVGAAGANCAEGTAGPTGTATSALLRNSGGCMDTSSNSADFALGTPSPRNSSAAANSCTPACGQ
jgi:hypothetical protein